MVVQSANLRDGDDASRVRSLDRPRLMIASQERLDVTVQRRFAEHDHVVQALTPNRSDDAFHVGSLPRRAWGSENLSNTHGIHLLSEVIAEDAVAISQEIPWRGVPRESITELLGGPLGGGTGGDAEVKNPAPVVRQHQEDIQDLEPDCRYRKEIDRDHALEVILQESAPRLGRRSRLTRHLLADTGLPDDNADFEKLAVNPRRSPKRILPAQPSDQLPDVFRDRRSAGLPTSDLPCPERPESLAVPGNHSLWPNDDEGGSPIGPQTGKPCPEETISGRRFRWLHRALENANLLPQCEVLRVQSGTATEDGYRSRAQGPKYRAGPELLGRYQLSIYQQDRDLREPQEPHFSSGFMLKSLSGNDHSRYFGRSRNILRACRRHPITASMDHIQQRLSVKHGVITYMEEETCLILVAS